MIDSNLYTWSGGGEWNDPSDWQGGDDPDPTTGIPSRAPGADNEVEFDSSATIDDNGAATWLFDNAAVTFSSGASLDMTNSGETTGSIGINGGSLIFDASNLTADGTSVDISSDGSLIVEGGGSATIAATPGYTSFDEESGSVIVTGGSSLDVKVNQQLNFGGLVSVLDGATMATGGDVEAQFDGTKVKISGAGSHLTIANASATFGGGGTQSTLVQDSATLTTQYVLVAVGAHIDVTGAGSLFHATSIYLGGGVTTNGASVTIGGAGAKAVISGLATLEGSSALTVSNGAQAQIGGNLELEPQAASGGSAAPPATLTITGKNAKVSVAAALDAGGAGKGSKAEIKISDGGSLTVGGDMTLGETSGSSSTLTLSDSGSSLTVKGNLVVGVLGSASLIVDDHASLNVTGEIIIGDDKAASASATSRAEDVVGAATHVVTDVIKLDTLGSKPTTLREDCIVGDNEYGELDILSGNKLNANQKSITIGNQSLGYGTIVVSDASSTLSNFSTMELAVDGNGFLDVTGGGLVSGNYLRAGAGKANTDAEIDVSNAKLKLNYLVLGASSGKASLTVKNNGAVVLQEGFTKSSGGSFDIEPGGSVTFGSAPTKAGYLTIGAPVSGADLPGGRGELLRTGVYLKGTAAEYTAKTEIDGGFLEIQSTGAAGSGVISFEKGELDVSHGVKLANSIGDFNANDSIGLLGVVADKKSFSNHVLTLLEGNTRVYRITFDGNYRPFDFHLSESAGNTIVTYSSDAKSQSAFDPLSPSHDFLSSAVHDPLDFAAATGTWR